MGNATSVDPWDAFPRERNKKPACAGGKKKEGGQLWGQKKRVMVRFLAISYLDTILQENSVKLQRIRQPPSSVPAQNNPQSQPPAERRTFITVLLAAEVFIPILYFNLLSPLPHLLSPFPPISFTSSSEELFHHLALPLSPRDHRLSAHRCTAPSLYPSHHHR